MLKKVLPAFLIIIILFNLVSCGVREQKKYEASFLVLFNSITKVIAYTDTEEEFQSFAEFIHDNLEEYHQLYDIYNDYPDMNNIKTINENAGIAPVKVDRRIIDLLLFSKEAYTLTYGKVNVAMGSVLRIWHNYRTEGIDDPFNAKLPEINELKEAARHIDNNNIIINEADSTVYLTEKEMSLDVGAIAKGYATEQVTQLAIEKGYTDFLLSVGGNTRAVGGKGKDKLPWNVGIQNPDKEAEQSSLYVLELRDLSLVTSGNYERYYTVDGKEYHHIIDPSTLMPAQYFTAVSIICQDSGLADALSTAIYNLPYEEGKALIDKIGDVEALWIFEDKTMKYTENFNNLLH